MSPKNRNIVSKRESDKLTRDSSSSWDRNRPKRFSPGKKKSEEKSSHGFLYFNLIIGTLFAVFCYSAYLYYDYLLQSRITTPSEEPKAVARRGLDVPDMYWGSYRPGLYFGLKVRHPNSPVFGLMWFSQHLVNNQLPIRHWCEMGDYEQRYTWLQHDGRNFGVQEINDGEFVIETSFVKRVGGTYGGDWTSRVTVLPKAGVKNVKPISLLFYVALDGEGRLEPHVKGTRLESISGVTDATGAFRTTFRNNGSNVLMSNYLSTMTPGLEVLNEVVKSSLFYHSVNKNKFIGLGGERFQESDSLRRPNFIAHQVTVSLPFEMEIVYESASFVERPNSLVGKVYDETLNLHRRKFDDRFEDVFHLSADGNNYTKELINFAKASFSNLIGGIGYFSGQSIVQSLYNKQPVMYFRSPLYTSVPSRSFFPRGFLWDEGFHNLLIGKWDSDITKDIIAHWLDTMNVDGWIPREQILDRESRARVPEEFIVQRDTNANPPTLFLPLRMMLNNMEKKSESDVSEDVIFFRRILPRLKTWFNWFNTTQVGKLPGSYRWKGRNGDNLEELNPITLTSGLDDYPRASHPTEDERHIDLRCWIAFAASVLADVAKVVGDESWEKYAETSAYLSDNVLLDALHWSSDLHAYGDYGLHTDRVWLAKPKPIPGAHPTREHNVPIRVYGEDPKLQFVNAFGYVSLFPFLLQMLDPTSSKLEKVLDVLDRPKLLWTDYGLRSLAKTASFYQKNNRHDSPPYWRGAIWINMNYLAVEALAYYSRVEGPYRSKARELHSRLRKNLVQNLYKEYGRTGYIWEQYNDVTGNGQRAHPFTGWSSLITLVMSDQGSHLQGV